MTHGIRENDSMISVGETPWHGLGTTLQTPPATAAEALELAGLNWEVRKLPMFLEDGRMVDLRESVSRSNDGTPGCVIRTDTNEMLGVVGPAYTVYQNASMGALFDPLIQDGTITIETAGSLFGGRRVWMLGKFGQNAQIDRNDEVAKYLLLAHGHDGRFAVRFGFTPIRVVCRNTLSASINDENSKLMRCLHTANLEQNLIVLRNAMQAAEQVFDLTAEQYRLLASRGVNRTDLREYARQVIKADEDESKRSNPEKEKIAAIMTNAMHGKGNRGSNWWHAYNGVTEYICWQAGRDAQNRVSEAWWGSGQSMSQRALELAVQMSGLA